MKNYLMAIRINMGDGKIIEGNMPFNTDEPLSAKHLAEAVKFYCSKIPVDPEKAVILAVIPLEA